MFGENLLQACDYVSRAGVAQAKNDYAYIKGRVSGDISEVEIKGQNGSMFSRCLLEDQVVRKSVQLQIP
jgi:hypothetical protein